MMAARELITVVAECKSKLDKENNEKAVKHILRKLEQIKMSLEILQITGIGKTVNKFTKWNGDVALLSKHLIDGWKEIVNNVKSGKDGKSERIESTKYSSDYSKTTDSSAGVSNANFKQSIASNSKGKDKNQNNGLVMKRKSSEPETVSKKKMKYVEDDSNIKNSLSFEDCLGMSDNHKRKKKQKTNNFVSDSPRKQKHSEKRTVESEKPTSRHSKSKEKTSPQNASTSSSSPVRPPSLTKPVEFSLPQTLTLPEIQANYRPIRNHYIIDDSNVNQKKKNTELDDNYFISSRHIRTQVFSGRKSKPVPIVPSLRNMCVRMIRANLRLLIQEWGPTIRYDVLEPLVSRLAPHQLQELEQYNKNLKENTIRLWKLYCQKEFKNSIPSDNESWRKLYKRLSREREAKLRNVTANISASMAKSLPVRTTKLAYVDTPAKPSRAIARQQIKSRTGEYEVKPLSNKAKLINSITANVANSTSEVVTLPTVSSKSSSFTSPSSQANGQQPQKTVKKVAPLMQKTLKFLKNRFRR